MLEVKVLQTPNLKRNYTFSARFMKDVGDKVKERSQRRTLSGHDVEGKKFHRYTPEYAMIKKTHVNLKLSGDMLKDISVKAIKDKVTIKAFNFKAKFHQYMGVGKKRVIRTWFGVGKDFDRILKVLMNREFRRLNNKKVT